MKKSFNYFRANPGGNITGFVLNPLYPGYRKPYTDCIREQIDSSVEQVGFISPAYEGAPLRMDMMGGEFCANATRAYGLYSATFYETDGPVDIEVYVSGKEGTTDVIANVKESTAYVAIEPAISKKEIEVDGKKGTLVVLPGISHLIFEEKEDEKLVEKALEVLKKDYKDDAYGVVFFDRDKMEIIPHIYVEGTETLVREGSCGSATAAIMYYLHDDIKELGEDYKEVVKQPGGELEVFTYEFEDGLKYCVGGKVELSEVEKIQIDVPQDIINEVIEHHKEEVREREAHEKEESEETETEE
ncbi:hypothetical protein KQI68_08620 [Peptoniphilus sp. MSJ-1]|uniref:Diaminopimelate epimerase n=1 Tax=Peptoniphilus ovalis TaxID=2841503 RepID=A0ABS6FIU4_9FIRM|nr:hypothetical protein [Peptoniphilus ovalis]MBU5669896.1 hypothetical protein [Peptoniphilus ovalis]